MRAVALSDSAVQERIRQSFVPLKVVIPFPKTAFPLDWPALAHWRTSYGLMDGTGFTGCSVVSADLEIEYGNTGSALVWELFDSTAYDAAKFAAMLDRAAERWSRERAIRADKALNAADRERRLAAFRGGVRAAVGREGRFRLPPRGFTVEGAVELFRLSGDLPRQP
uniref:Uncharacterized protein n=1 Tax=uncultured Armatimonadetes bacterium TaxID=157466 RepID=A0A6J4H1A4_9BACT|nr:hypothetical protein AVDCRST_MAG63-13 [uncultured Armatimonadetes bacterium]